MNIEKLLEEALDKPDCAKAAHAILCTQIWAAEFVRARAERAGTSDRYRVDTNAAAFADQAVQAYCRSREGG